MCHGRHYRPTAAGPPLRKAVGHSDRFGPGYAIHGGPALARRRATSWGSGGDLRRPWRGCHFRPRRLPRLAVLRVFGAIGAAVLALVAAAAFVQSDMVMSAGLCREL